MEINRLKDLEKSGGGNSIILSPKRIMLFLFGIMTLLLIADVAVITMGTVMEIKNTVTGYLARYFNFNGENNVPAFFSTIILLLASILLVLNAASAGKHKKYWYILSLLFLFLCLDENIQIHEQFNSRVSSFLPGDMGGLLYWDWVVPYFIFFCLVVAFFLPFVLKLDKSTRFFFFLSGAIFVTGAVGLELIEGYVYKRYGIDHLYNMILYTLEETMEMTGVILFNYSLLVRLAVKEKSVKLLPDRNAGMAGEGLVGNTRGA